MTGLSNHMSKRPSPAFNKAYSIGVSRRQRYYFVSPDVYSRRYIAYLIDQNLSRLDIWLDKPVILDGPHLRAPK